MAILRLAKTPVIQLHELASMMQPEALPAVATNIGEWSSLVEFFDVVGTGKDWLGYDVHSERHQIAHPVFFMGQRSKRDHRCGHLNFVEISGTNGVFRFSLLEMKDANARNPTTTLDVRASSKDFLDMIFIMAKTALD